MTEQLQLRRGTAAQVAAFTGAQGEVVVDTTNNRLVVQDGATAGGFAAAKLSDIAANARTAVSDAAYSALATDRAIAFNAITAPRIVALPAASAYPTGATLIVFDESGSCSAANTITLAAAGADKIDGVSSTVISSAYGYVALQSNGAGKWTIVDAPGGGGGTTVGQRTAVSDTAYAALIADRLIAFTALTAARAVTLCAASSYPTGTRLMIVDESGACSASKTITVNRAGSDLIDGATSFVINAAYAGLEIESNGANAWTILSPKPNLQAALVGIGTPPDPNNVLSAYGASALFNGVNFSFTINKAAAVDTASIIFEDGFSGRAQMGLNGSDNFSFKVSPNGSSWTTAIALDATTGAATLANQRTPVSDAAYTALVTDRLIAYSALTAARAVTLPSASAYPPGQQLVVADESGACSATKTITLSRAGSDTINGATSAVIATAYGYLALASDGVSKWTIVDANAAFTGDSGSGGAAGLVPAPAAGDAAANKVLGAGGVWRPARPMLTANTTLCVATTGNDNNPGTSGSPFATINKALAVAASYDCSTFNLTISIGDGTWPGMTLPAMIGSGTFSLIGNVTTPANCILSSTVYAFGAGAVWTINGFKFTSSSSCIYASNLSSLTLGTAVNFGASGSAHIWVTNGASVAASSYAISGSALWHMIAEICGQISIINGTVTLSGTPAFSQQFAASETGSVINIYGETYSGAATGTRYLALSNGVIETYGQSSTYLPGSVAGSTSAGGQYL